MLRLQGQQPDCRAEQFNLIHQREMSIKTLGRGKLIQGSLLTFVTVDHSTG